MYNLLYNFFGNFYCPCLPPVAAGPVSGTHGNTCQFESQLLDWDLTQKLHNNLYNVHNNNTNVLKVVWKVHQLYTRCMAQLAIGGLVTGQVHISKKSLNFENSRVLQSSPEFSRVHQSSQSSKIFCWCSIYSIFSNFQVVNSPCTNLDPKSASSLYLLCLCRTRKKWLIAPFLDMVRQYLRYISKWPRD